MKIAQVVCVYPPYAGGIGTSALKLQKTLSAQFDSSVFTIRDKYGITEDDEKNNIIRLGGLPWIMQKNITKNDMSN